MQSQPQSLMQTVVLDHVHRWLNLQRVPASTNSVQEYKPILMQPRKKKKEKKSAVC